MNAARRGRAQTVTARLLLLALSTFVLFLSTLVGTPVLPELAAELGADSGATAAILSASLSTVVLLQFFTGGLADRYGRKLILGAAALAGGLTSLGCALAGDWRWLLAMRVLGGVADAVSMPALLGLTAEIGDGRQGTFFGVLRSAQGLSFILGPALGGLFSLFSLRAPFVVDAVLSLAACVLLVAMVPAGAGPSRREHDWTQLRRLKTLLSERRFYAYALFTGVDSVAYPVLSAFVPIKARSLGAQPGQISLMLTLSALCFSLASWGVGRASDRWGRRPFVLAAQPGVLVACTGLALAQSWPWMVVWRALFGLAGGTTFLLGLVMAADVIPAQDASGTLGAFDAAVDLLMVISAAIALALHARFERASLMLWGAGLLSLAAFPVALRVKETRVLRDGPGDPSEAASHGLAGTGAAGEAGE